MIKKTITYTDYNGTSRTEDFYFNLSRAELMDLEFSKKGGLNNWMQSVVDSHSEPEIWDLFKVIIGKSYGVRTSDGRQFQKSDEITKMFMETEAYSEFLMELVNDSDKAAEFVNGLVYGAASPADKSVLKLA